MKKFVVLFAMLASQVALADGFVCETEAGDLNIKLYNHTSPELGTRSAAMMVLSDPSVSYGRKTIAKFSGVKGTLSSKNLTYVADVDLRFADSRAKGENIGGTKLGELSTVAVYIGFSYNQPLSHGDELGGTLILTKRNGQKIRAELVCERYLKN